MAGRERERFWARARVGAERLWARARTVLLTEPSAGEDLEEQAAFAALGAPPEALFAAWDDQPLAAASPGPGAWGLGKDCLARCCTTTHLRGRSAFAWPCYEQGMVSRAVVLLWRQRLAAAAVLGRLAPRCDFRAMLAAMLGTAH